MRAAEGTSAVFLESPSGRRLGGVCSLDLATLPRAPSSNISKAFAILCSLLVINTGQEGASARLPRRLGSRAPMQQRLKG